MMAGLTKWVLGVVAVVALLAICMLGGGCATLTPNEEASSGWQEAQVHFNFYPTGQASDAESAEGDDTPSGRIVLNESTITVTVSNGGGAVSAEQVSGDAAASPEVDTTLDLPGVVPGS